jgi:SagB-type dehydrogenase family enzyme
MFEISITTIYAITLEQPFAPNFAKKAAVVFAWSSIPYRSEWKYEISAHKKILIDVGHVYQSLYLASETIEAGACAIGIYDHKLIDEVLALDEDEELKKDSNANCILNNTKK